MLLLSRTRAENPLLKQVSLQIIISSIQRIERSNNDASCFPSVDDGQIRELSDEEVLQDVDVSFG
jgi:hypothetical protein